MTASRERSPGSPPAIAGSPGAQLLALGVGADRIDRRIELGRLIPIHRGVYAVGHEALSDRGRIIVALLAARLAETLTRAGQPAAAFSNRSASRPIPSSAAAAAPPA